MAAVIELVFFLLNGLCTLIIWALILTAILSCLVAFRIIDTRGSLGRRIHNFLYRIVAPIPELFRRFIPSAGGVDLSFFVASLVTYLIGFWIIKAAQLYLLPSYFALVPLVSR